MTAYPMKRVRYYDGQFLLSSDFIDEQSYHDEQLALHARTQHFWGIAEGLEVIASTTDPQSVDVKPGAAVDGQGNHILIESITNQRFVGTGAGTWHLVIQFGEKTSDPAAAKYIPGYTRWLQNPGLVFTSSPSSQDVVLATLTLTGAKGAETLSALSSSNRTYAGLRVAGPSKAGFNLRARGDGSLVLERFVADDLSLTPILYVPSSGGLGLGIGAAPPSGALLAVGSNNELTVSSMGALLAPSVTASAAISGQSLSASGNTQSATLSVGGAPAPSGTGAVAVGTTAQLRIDASGNLSTTGTATVGTTGQFKVSAAGVVTITGLNASQAVFTDASKTLTTTGTVGVGQGGTGATALSGVLKGNGSNAFSAMTGTASRGARWSDASTLAAGGVFDDGTNVGVGAAAPTGAMFAVGTTSAFKVDASGNLTVPQITFSPLPADPSPVITARTIPAGQGGSSERTELIIFHGNDGFSQGPDTITLRAPTIRLQTYNDPSIGDINNNAGSNDRLVVDPNGVVTVGGRCVMVGPDSVEQLKTIRGTVSATGGVLQGRGWSVSAKGGGLYDITFASGVFTANPTVVATMLYPNTSATDNGGLTTDNCVIVYVSTTMFRIKTGDNEGHGDNRPFSFIAMGT